MPIGHFLGGVAGLIQDRETHEYLLLRRVEHKDFQAGAWECVTGRVNQGESYEEALYREVLEETGLHVQIEFVIGTTHFYRGSATPENELLGIIYGCSVNEKSIVHIMEEHSEWRWVSMTQAGLLLPPDHWLLKTIRRADFLSKILPPEFQDEFLQNGFEI